MPGLAGPAFVLCCGVYLPDVVVGELFHDGRMQDLP
jgi:hypothetical protein